MLDADLIDPYTLSNFFPRNTGLPMTVWAQVGEPGVSPRLLLSSEGDGHGWPERFIVVELEREPLVIDGNLAPSARQAVERWVSLNKAALLDHWTGRYDSADLARAAQAL